ncbi:hypothetical protein F511_39291 [Dorcoceras hygrometricum]|uniref:Uncharacterized protein n=1 Tax=Dorcoceras hygrometricum TaxID=472368 RepID=A0A2Z7BR58_9LAMI|nr:hypothetical protein F511_39291 [Dorcoceras hygrometricum]
MSEPSLKPLSPVEWESLIDDYSHGGAARLHRWTSLNYSSTPLLHLCLSSLLRKDFSLLLKLNLLTFIEQNSASLSSPHSLPRLLESLRSVVQSTAELFPLKDQFLITTTSIFISCSSDHYADGFKSIVSPLTDLVELLLTIINRPNHGVDRHTRGIACECLRQLELAFPCLLSEVLPNFWALCQSERTHVSQSYVLLLSTTLLNVVKLKPSPNTVASINNAAIPLIPFNVPQFFIDGSVCDFVWKENETSYRELRRVMAFLLEWPFNLTPFGLMEFMVAILPVAEELELQASLLRVQFSGLLSTYEPLLCHAFLGMYLKFLDSFQGQETEVAHGLLLLSKDSQHQLVFRLLGLHWLLGFFGLVASNDLGRKKSFINMSKSFYPRIFDPLAMKALKLDLIAAYSVLLCSPRDADGSDGVETGTESYEVKLFQDGLVSTSAFKWLPPWSTETAVAFRTLHKLFVGASPHSDDGSTCVDTLAQSNIFITAQNMLMESTSEFQGLVPVTVEFIDRLLGCYKHHWLGEHLLKTLDKHLLQKLKIDYSLGSYFPIFERISENDKVSPSGLLELLKKFILFLVEKHDPDTGLKSWYHGSKVLGVCRTMLVHHHSSSLFIRLSRLLAFTCLYFPDLEVRDNARFYLRILVCIPGKKLRQILNTEESLPGVTPSTHPSSFFNKQSTQTVQNLKGSGNITSYIHLERVTPLLVKQAWSLSLPNMHANPDKPGFLEGIWDNEPASEEKELTVSANMEIFSESERLQQPKEPLRVMDSKVSEIVGVLRRHFSCIPDYRHMPGLKIKISCSLRFDAEPFCSVWGKTTTTSVSDEVDKLPAIYATVLKFTSSSPYGSISSFHNAFLLGSTTKTSALTQADALAIVPVDNSHSETFEANVCLEFEPREPVPGLVDVFIETNTDNCQVIRGQLSSIPVGIEDMFLRAILPDDIKGDDIPSYYVNLFTALWEACETTSSTGRETFVLKGGKGVAAIKGTRSVKYLEVPMTSLVLAVERNLAPFVVRVTGEPLVDMVDAGGVIKDTVWKDFKSDPLCQVSSSNVGPIYLKYMGTEDGIQDPIPGRKIVGVFDILIFLPPRFHLLFQMEVHDVSTLVRIRTDHWPCLAYVDDYLEALFLD